ncbi:hypothetical protein F4680DRAFT_421742 [Xylaria scruposa]|nr:hypothetical protein F4680DRAFT_421742 [Xylaria scruposa]
MVGIAISDLSDAYAFWDGLRIDVTKQHAKSIERNQGPSPFSFTQQERDLWHNLFKEKYLWQSDGHNLLKTPLWDAYNMNLGAVSRGPASCDNTYRVLFDLSVIPSGNGFIQDLRRLCLEASIYRCDATNCRTRRNETIKKTAPKCSWVAFRDWAIVLMSCRAFHPWEFHESDLDKQVSVQVGYTVMHAPDVVNACCQLLKAYAAKDEPGKGSMFCGTDDNLEINVSEVINVIHWMAVIQSTNGVGPNIGRWDHNYLPMHLASKSIEQAIEVFNRSNICKRRLWRLLDASPRKTWDILDVAELFQDHSHLWRQTEHHDGWPNDDRYGDDRHVACTPSLCHIDIINTTKERQIHKAPCVISSERNFNDDDRRCSLFEFDHEKLRKALYDNQPHPTAWTADLQLASKYQSYIAISHVWSDGTGIGLRKAGTVNACLFKYFMDIAIRLGAEAVWWDAVSVPVEKHARAKAMSGMADQYANASYTIVHDSHLLSYPWSKEVNGKRNGGPCLALVLSSWFTRGWTAVELALSKNVIVLFKGETEDKPTLVDLNEIVSSDPRTCTRGHWLASQLIQRLRKPIENVGDLLAILSQRITSWARDRSEISAVLAGAKIDYDSEDTASKITQKTIIHLGKIPHSCLLHNTSTMSTTGSFSWCPATIDGMPFDISVDMRIGIDARKQSMLIVNADGVAMGEWYCCQIEKNDVKDLRIVPLGHEPVVTFQAQAALEDPNRCILLRPFTTFDGRAVLAMTYRRKTEEPPVLSCRYITTVMTHQFESRPWQVLIVRLGEKTLNDPIIAMEAIHELKSELARRQGPPRLNPIQRVKKRAGLMDEVMPGSYTYRYSSGRIQYVEDAPFGSGRASSERLFHPDIEDLNSALRDSHKGEAVARWIIRRNPELIHEMVSRLLQGGLTQEQQCNISSALVKAIPISKFRYPSLEVYTYQNLLEFCERTYTTKLPEFLQDAKTALEKSRRFNFEARTT